VVVIVLVGVVFLCGAAGAQVLVGPIAQIVPTEPDLGQPQDAVPPPEVDRAFGFGSWPTYDLSPSCVTLHDRYWVEGPDSKAYHTWHPAIVPAHPETGESCDFGHEHGNDPSTSPLFGESGGWPPFGYVAEVAAGARHEDHVGHKITVARYRAAFGNSADTTDTLHDAGFDCDWLSKIHQGSFSVDALANHLHEYFLTFRCDDGSTPAESTAFSIKIMYTYGEPNQFKDIASNSVISALGVVDPDGVLVPPAMQDTPINPNVGARNPREFSSPGPFIWKTFDEISQVDLWTENVTIETDPFGHSLVIGPYYVIKNPSRVYNADTTYAPVANSIVRTIDLCYDSGGNRLTYPFCAVAPLNRPADWTSPESPYNGTLRAVNFKALPMYNAGGPTSFCTDPFGQAGHAEPCLPGEIRQTANSISNGWDSGDQGFGQDHYWVNAEGQRVYDRISGSLVGAIPLNDGEGGYAPAGIGFEWIIDNRDPDDDGDGLPDGANVRGQN